MKRWLWRREFMGAIGAFLGWQATIFYVDAPVLMIGAAVGSVLIVLQKRQRIIAIALRTHRTGAVIWIFWGPRYGPRFCRAMI